MDASHGRYDDTTVDATAKQATPVAAGHAHPIGSLMLHIVQSEDYIVNAQLQAQSMRWDREG